MDEKGVRVLRISLILNGGNREKQLERTLESIKMQTRQPDEIIVVTDDSNGAPHISHTWNKGAKQATGEILILQNAEVKYTTPEDIESLVRLLEDNTSSLISTYASCQYLKQNGEVEGWYIHPEFNPRFLNFCQAVKRYDYNLIGGFDECYIGYGSEDADFSFRLLWSGVQPIILRNVIVQHQWHEHNIVPNADALGNKNKERFLIRRKAIETGLESYIANENSLRSRSQT